MKADCKYFIGGKEVEQVVNNYSVKVYKDKTNNYYITTFDDEVAMILYNVEDIETLK